MKILFVTAEEPELDACARACAECGVEADLVHTGMGAAATASVMDEMLSSGRKYDLVIDAGIAGSFTGATHGAAFNVVEEMHGENPDRRFRGAEPVFHWLPSVSGVTFQQMTVDPAETGRRKALGAQVESMEGAAFFEACHRHGVKRFAELRTISNAVGEKDRARWDIPAGLDALYVNCRRLLDELNRNSR